ncbi:FKBP53 [Symbiodinium sp. CCMP2456]|nr:FKBP53 [Symbiodinium sp. CCMP2456]
MGKEPAIFDLGKGEVIKGWEAGIPTMRVGEEARLTIAPELAYGVEGAGAFGVIIKSEQTDKLSEGSEFVDGLTPGLMELSIRPFLSCHSPVVLCFSLSFSFVRYP